MDCLWPDRRVVVELDGRQHERPHQADSDDDRDLWLRAPGYVARRYAKKQIDGRPQAVIADRLAAFAEAAALGLSTHAHVVARDQEPSSVSNSGATTA